MRHLYRREGLRCLWKIGLRSVKEVGVVTPRERHVNESFGQFRAEDVTSV